MKPVGLLAIMWLLAGCDQWAVTPEDISGQPIIGHWYYAERVREGDTAFFQRLYLHVRGDGRVLYANLLCRTALDGGIDSHSRLVLEYMPIKRISVKTMVLQQFPLTPKFQLKLGAWTDQGDGVFEVDGLPLEPITAEAAPDYSAWDCD